MAEPQKSGKSFASRVCGSLVRSAGLPELVCETPEDFVRRAVALAGDPAAIAALKSRLEAGRDNCTLFDTPLLARRLEALYRSMCADYRRGDLPRPDLSNLDDPWKRAGREGPRPSTDCRHRTREIVGSAITPRAAQRAGRS